MTVFSRFGIYRSRGGGAATGCVGVFRVDAVCGGGQSAGMDPLPARVGAEPLLYAEPEALRRPARLRVIGSVSIAAGCGGRGVNALVAEGMAHQIFKQRGGVKGVSRGPFIERWLMVTGAEAVLSAAMAADVSAAGAATLRRPGRWSGLHRW